ncbi:hypothetical protein [Desulfoscipio gibsoniae]
MPRKKPDRYDWIGAVIALTGAAIIIKKEKVKKS